jgi:hypothetical protein
MSVLKYGFIFEYFYVEDDLWRELCDALREMFELSIAKHKSASFTSIRFNHIPFENVLSIMSYMDAKSLSRFGQTCKLYSEPSLLDRYWDRLCKHDFCISVHSFKSRSKYVMSGSRQAKQLYVRYIKNLNELFRFNAGVTSLPEIPALVFQLEMIAY